MSLGGEKAAVTDGDGRNMSAHACSLRPLGGVVDIKNDSHVECELTNTNYLFHDLAL